MFIMYLSVEETMWVVQIEGKGRTVEFKKDSVRVEDGKTSQRKFIEIRRLDIYSRHTTSQKIKA